MHILKKSRALLLGPLVLGAVVLFPFGSAAQVPPEDVPESLETAIEAEIESRGETYAGLCHEIEQNDHVGEWCATVQTLTETEAGVTFGAVASDEIEEATFVSSDGEWMTESGSPTPTNSPQASTPEPTSTTAPPPATATPRPNNIQAPNTGDGGLR